MTGYSARSALSGSTLAACTWAQRLKRVIASIDLVGFGVSSEWLHGDRFEDRERAPLSRHHGLAEAPTRCATRSWGRRAPRRAGRLLRRHALSYEIGARALEVVAHLLVELVVDLRAIGQRA